MILASSAPEKVLAKLVLDEVCTLWGYNFICDLHEKFGLNITNSIISNVFFKNLSKEISAMRRKEQIIEFKSRQLNFHK